MRWKHTLHMAGYNRSSNTVRTIVNPLQITVEDDLRLFDALSPRVRAAFNYSTVKLSATPRLLLMHDDEILALVAKVSEELTMMNPSIVSAGSMPERLTHREFQVLSQQRHVGRE